MDAVSAGSDRMKIASVSEVAFNTGTFLNVKGIPVIQRGVSRLPVAFSADFGQSKAARDHRVQLKRFLFLQGIKEHSSLPIGRKGG